jgi:hypothetical protein
MMSQSAGTPPGLDGDLGRGHQRVRRGAQPDGATELSFPGTGRALRTSGLPHPRSARERGRRGRRSLPGLLPGSARAAPWICTGCSPTVTGWKPARSLPMAEVPTTQTAHVSPSRGSGRATMSGGAWRPPPADAELGLRRSAGASRCRQRLPNERHHGAGGSRLASARASGVGALWAA